MIQSTEDFSILLMKKPCIQGDSGTLGVQIPFGVLLFSLLRDGIGWSGRDVCTLPNPVRWKN